MRVSEATISYKNPVPFSEQPQITGSKDCYNILLYNCYEDGTIEHREKMVALYLSRANRVVSWVTIGLGGINSTVADIRIILQAALLCNACSIVLAHNHPSGQLQPSEADIKLTTKVQQAAKLMEIDILDHVIVTSYDYYSFADAGQL